MGAHQGYEKKYVFNKESIKLTHEGRYILNVPVFDIFLRQKMFHLSIILFISGVEKPDIDTKLNNLKSY